MWLFLPEVQEFLCLFVVVFFFKYMKSFVVIFLQNHMIIHFICWGKLAHFIPTEKYLFTFRESIWEKVIWHQSLTTLSTG